MLYTIYRGSVQAESTLPVKEKHHSEVKTKPAGRLPGSEKRAVGNVSSANRHLNKVITGKAPDRYHLPKEGRLEVTVSCSEGRRVSVSRLPIEHNREQHHTTMRRSVS